MDELLQNKEIVFASQPDNINLVETLVEDLKTELGLSEELEANILVSLSEAVNNAIFHGNQLDAKKNVKVEMAQSGNALVFTVEDEGSGFDSNNVLDPTAPENIDKPAGRGIFLIKSLADKVDFEDSGRKVVMTFFQN